LPSGWRRTPSGITGSYGDVANHTDDLPAVVGTNIGGFGYRIACRCAASSALFVECAADREGPDHAGAWVGWSDRIAPIGTVLSANILGVLWVTENDPIVLGSDGLGGLTGSPFAVLDPARVQPQKGDVVRAVYDPHTGGGRLSCVVAGTLWGYTDNIAAPAFRYAGLIGANLGVGQQTYDWFSCGCV
jgi:hypothetical protein